MRALGLFGFLGVSFAALVAMDKITRPIVVKQTEQVRKSELFYIFLRTSFSTIALARELSNLVHTNNRNMDIIVDPFQHTHIDT